MVQAVSMIPATNIHDLSSKLCKTLQNQTAMAINSNSKSKVIRREVKSLRAIGVRLGEEKIIMRITTLLCYDVVANQTFTLLSTFPTESIHNY